MRRGSVCCPAWCHCSGPLSAHSDRAACREVPQFAAGASPQLHQPGRVEPLRRLVGAHPCAGWLRPSGTSPSRAWPWTALGAAHPRVPEGLGALLAMDALLRDQERPTKPGVTGWFWSGMARQPHRWGPWPVTLLAAVGSTWPRMARAAYPLCARQSPGSRLVAPAGVRDRAPVGKQAGEMALALLGGGQSGR